MELIMTLIGIGVIWIVTVVGAYGKGHRDGEQHAKRYDVVDLGP